MSNAGSVFGKQVRLSPTCQVGDWMDVVCSSNRLCSQVETSEDIYLPAASPPDTKSHPWARVDSTKADGFSVPGIWIQAPEPCADLLGT